MPTNATPVLAIWKFYIIHLKGKSDYIQGKGNQNTNEEYDIETNNEK